LSYPSGKITFRIALLCGLLSLTTPGFGGQESRIRAVVEGAAIIALRGNVNRGAVPEHDRGALDLSVPIQGMRLILGQTKEQAAALEQLLEDQRNPSAPDYQRWLTPEEYGERFGVTDDDLAQLAAWLQSQGFTVKQIARAHNWISFSGTAGAVRDAFHTELHYYESDGKRHFANATEPLIPASLARVVDAIRGLDDFRPEPQPQTFKAIPDFDASNGFHYIGPADLATIYDIQALYIAGFDGTGQKLVIAGQTDINLSDIRAFRAQFALPAKDPQLVLVGSDPGTSQSDQIEANLDLEWSGAVARNASIIYVYSQNVFESLEYAIDQNLAPVVSVSYGGCETSSPLSFRTLAQQANAEGITWMNASGDSGAAGCDDDGERAATQGPAVTFPADIPEVTAVGGSELNEGSANYWSAQNGSGLKSALSYIPEEAWNDTSQGYGLASGGGGASTLYAKPWWQSGPGVPNDQARDVPDVSLTASGDHDGYVIYSGGLISVGGTSASSPSFAGIVTILNQYLTAKGAIAKPGLGNINPSLYSLAANTTGLFHDITNGNNVVHCALGSEGCGSGSFGYAAGPGYDLATGLGSVDAYNLVTGWTSLGPAVGTKATLTASPAAISSSGTTALIASISPVAGNNPPNGSVTFSLGGTPLGSAALTSGASANGAPNATAMLSVEASNLAVGSNAITASYTPAGNFGTSTAATNVTVSAAVTGTSTVVTASPAGIAQNNSTVLTALVKQTGGNISPAGVVTFTAGRAPLGQASLTASAAGAIATLTISGSKLSVGANAIAASYVATAGFTGSTGTAIVTVTQTPVATTTTVTATPASMTQTGSTILTATVTATSGSAVPTGAVTFASGSTTLGSAKLSATGSSAMAAFTLKGAGLPIGSDQITVTYSGAVGFATSSGSIPVSVTGALTTTSATLTAMPASITRTQSSQLTMTVRSSAGSIGAGGKVAFSNGNVPLGTAAVTVSGGVGTAALTVMGTNLSPGSNNITATYTAAGGAAGLPTWVAVNVAPSPVTTAMTLSASPAAIASSGSTQVAATITAAAGNNTPTGTVIFMAGSAPMGSALLRGSAGVASASLTVRANGLVLGANTITAVYSGAGFAPVSASATVIVNAPASPDVQSDTAAAHPEGNSLPLSCAPGDSFTLLSGATGIYTCVTANIWVLATPASVFVCGNNASHDDAPEIQKIVDSIGSAGGGTIVFTGGACWINSLPHSPTAIGLWYDNLTLNMYGVVFNSTLPAEPHATVLGPLWTTSWLQFKKYAMSPATRAGMTVTLLNPADAANFKAGDAVYLESGEVASGTPFNSEGNVVKSVNGTVLNLMYPLVHNYSNDGVNPAGIADVQSETRYNLVMEGLNTVDGFQIGLISLSQYFHTVFRDWNSSTIPGITQFSHGDDRDLLLDNVTSSVGDPEGGQFQVATGMADITLQNSHFNCQSTVPGVSSQIVASEGSANIEIAGGDFRGSCAWGSGSRFDGLNVHGASINLDGGPAVEVQFLAGDSSSGNPDTNFSDNTFVLPAVSTGRPNMYLGGPGLIFCGNRISSAASGYPALVFGGNLDGAEICNNTGTFAGSAFLFFSADHGFTVTGNNLIGPGQSGDGIEVGNNGVQTKSPAITGNTLTDFAIGIQVDNLANEFNPVMAPNAAGNSAVPYNPATLSNLGDPSGNPSVCADGPLACLAYRASAEPEGPPAGRTHR